MRLSYQIDCYILYTNAAPEMEVSQLMVVSIGGLLVNLFGMFAMGGVSRFCYHMRLLNEK